MPPMYSTEQFATAIREKYPNKYDDLDDFTLSQKWVKAKPAYAGQVDLTEPTQPIQPTSPPDQKISWIDEEIKKAEAAGMPGDIRALSAVRGRLEKEAGTDEKGMFGKWGGGIKESWKAGQEQMAEGAEMIQSDEPFVPGKEKIDTDVLGERSLEILRAQPDYAEKYYEVGAHTKPEYEPYAAQKALRDVPGVAKDEGRLKQNVVGALKAAGGAAEVIASPILGFFGAAAKDISGEAGKIMKKDQYEWYLEKGATPDQAAAATDADYQNLTQSAGKITAPVMEFMEKHPLLAESLKVGLWFAGAKPAAKIAEKSVVPAEKALFKVGEEVVERVPKVVGRTMEAVPRMMTKTKSLFTKPVKNIDEVVIQADKATAVGIRTVAEETAPKITIREKWAGIRPDIKKRITGKHEQLKEYFDIAHARNLDDTVPTPLEWGAKAVEKGRDELKTVLNNTGSDIGKFRQKIATFKIAADDMNIIQNTFDNSLDNLNLIVKNGKVVRQSGKVKGKVSDSEIKLLNTLRDDLQSVKAAPTVENLIDLRNSFDNTINFAKTAKEASNVVDPISRATRGMIRDINLKIIGKGQGKLLDDYSDLIGLLTDLNKFVDSRSGGEFLLKRVLSERGRVPRELMNKLKEYTGVDLMDDAVMAQLATEIIGNSAQKGLFRQEITKAGLDASDIIDLASGAPGAGMRATKTLFEKGKTIIAPVEETFLKATKPKKN